MCVSILRVSLFCVLFVLSCASAYADDAKPERVRIVTDQDKGTAIFVIDDKPVAQIDAGGLHVVDHIHYGGTLTDTGPDYIRGMIERAGPHAE